MQKILIVDDEPSIVRPLQFVLKRCGYHILTASNGIEALEAAKREHPTLIFLDLMMPKKDGKQVCQELRQFPETQDAYIIILSAKIVTKQEQEQIDANEFMKKPFNPLHVVEHVKQIMPALMANDK